MQNTEMDNASRLLSMSPELEEENVNPQKQHIEKQIIPPIGIAKPELVKSFMENIGDEDKIKQDIQEVESYARENPLQTAGRETISHGLRALEGLGGSIGGLLNLLSGEAYFDESGELAKHEVPMLPSASKLREFTKEKTGKKFEPKGEFSKQTQEYITDVGASLPLPGGWFAKLLIPAGGQSIKYGLQKQGVSEQNSEIAKQGFMLLSSIANIGNAPQIARNAYSEAINLIPQGTRMSMRPISNGLNRIKNQPWFRTGRTTSKGPAMDEIKRIEEAIQHGSSDVHDILQIRKDINEARKKLGAFHYEPGMDKASARRYLDEVDEVVREGLEDFGNGFDPKWYQQYERANQAYGVTQRSIQLQDFINSNAITKGLQSQSAKILFNIGGAQAVMNAPSLIAGAAAVAPAIKGIQVMNRMIRSPVLRNHYLDVLKQASLQNAAAMNRALQKFDDESKKLEKEMTKIKKK